MTLILSDKYAFENQKGTKTMLQAPRQRTLIETFQLRVQGLPLASESEVMKNTTPYSCHILLTLSAEASLSYPLPAMVSV